MLVRVRFDLSDLNWPTDYRNVLALRLRPCFELRKVRLDMIRTVFSNGTKTKTTIRPASDFGYGYWLFRTWEPNQSKDWRSPVPVHHCKLGCCTSQQESCFELSPAIYGVGDCTGTCH